MKRIIWFVMALILINISMAGSNELFITGIIRNTTTNNLTDATKNINITIYNGSTPLFSQIKINQRIDDGVYHTVFDSIIHSWFLHNITFRLKVGTDLFSRTEIVPVPLAHASFYSNDSSMLAGQSASYYWNWNSTTDIRAAQTVNTTADIRAAQLSNTTTDIRAAQYGNESVFADGLIGNCSGTNVVAGVQANGTRYCIAQSGAGTANTTDDIRAAQYQNETPFIQGIIGNCSASQQVFGFRDNGTRVCVADVSGASSGNTTDDIRAAQLFNTTADIWAIVTNGSYYFRHVVDSIIQDNFTAYNRTVIHQWNTSWITSNQVDTNASTACDDGEYLDGSGICIKIDSTYYNATNVSAETGTVIGLLSSTQHSDSKYDGITFNFTEAAGSPGLDLRMNFTNVTDFNQGIMRYKTSTLSGDFPIIMMWNYVLSYWEDYPIMGESLTFSTMTQPVFDSSDHLQNGIAQMRIYKAANGNTNNKYYVDWIAVAKSFGVPSGTEIDPYFNEWLHNASLESDLDGNGYTIYDITINGTLSNLVYNTTSDIQAAQLYWNDTDLNVNQINMTGNLSIHSNYVCYDPVCVHYTFYNGTHRIDT